MQGYAVDASPPPPQFQMLTSSIQGSARPCIRGKYSVNAAYLGEIFWAGSLQLSMQTLYSSVCITVPV